MRTAVKPGLGYPLRTIPCTLYRMSPRIPLIVGAMLLAACAQLRSPVAPTTPHIPTPTLDLTGTWLMTVESPMGSDDMSAQLVQDGEQLTGKLRTKTGDVPVSGRVKGEIVEFSMELDVQGSSLHIGYAGTVAKDEIAGTVEFGEMGQGRFTAKRM